MKSPFELQEIEDYICLDIVCDVESEHYALFDKYEYSGNGYCWESFVRLYLEEKLPDLLDDVDFDSESEACLIYFDSEKALKKFQKKVIPFFEDLSALEKFIAEADREMIDD